MLEEQRQDEGLEGQARSERVNQQVVKLLRQKTIPLNKIRYNRLQTLQKISPKHTRNQTLLPNLSAPQLHLSQACELPRITKARTSRGQVMPTADLLINRLKNLKDLKQSSQLLLKDQKAGRCWEVLRNSIIESEHSERKRKLSRLPTQKSLKISENGRRKRENLLQLAKKAERHLRQKKHELKQKHCQQAEYQQRGKKHQTEPTELQMLLTSFRYMRHGTEINDKQLQMQLLRDIREAMLQEKINRIKKDVNHKKIVQLR